jgi:alpha-1,4-digalacturonate transport system substrate-binding protein
MKLSPQKDYLEVDRVDGMDGMDICVPSSGSYRHLGRPIAPSPSHPVVAFAFRYLLILAGLTLLTPLAQAKTLTVLLLANASTQDVIQNLIHEYQQQNPGLDFNVSIVQYNSIIAKLNTLLTGGQPPDIVEITTAYIQNYAGQALDLGKYSNGQELLQRYLPSYRPFIVSGAKVFGVPMEATANGLFYNKKLFDKAGVQVPKNENEVWTWDQLKQAVLRVMKLPECRIGIAYDCSVQRWSNLLYQAGGRWLSADGKSFLPDHPPAEKALSYFRSLVNEKIVPSSSWPGNTDAGQLFKTGVAAMMWAGNWQLKTLVEGGTSFEFGTTYFPKDAIRATCPGGEFLFSFENSPNKDDAAKFLLWWAKPETTQHYLESLGGSLLSPMTDLKVNYGKYTEYLAPMLADLKITPDWVAVDLAQPALNRLQNDILNELVLGATGRETAQDTILHIEKLGNGVLKGE